MANINDAIAEMSGIRVCAAPGCTRQLPTGKGARTEVGGKRVITCFGPCHEWAKAKATTEALS